MMGNTEFHPVVDKLKENRDDVPGDVYELAVRLIEKADFVGMGYKPSGLAAAAVYAASELKERGLTQYKVSTIFDVSQGPIRNHHPKFEELADDMDVKTFIEESYQNGDFEDMLKMHLEFCLSDMSIPEAERECIKNKASMVIEDYLSGELPKWPTKKWQQILIFSLTVAHHLCDPSIPRHVVNSVGPFSASKPGHLVSGTELDEMVNHVSNENRQYRLDRSGQRNVLRVEY